MITGRPMSREKGYRQRQPAYDIDQSVSLDEPVYRLTLIIIAWPALFNGHRPRNNNVNHDNDNPAHESP